MKNILLIFTISFTLFNCSSNDKDSCNWIIINSINVSQETKNKLNNIFSENNNILDSKSDKEFLLKITNVQQLKSLSNDLISIDLDFDKYFIIGGRFETSSISNQVSKEELKVCESQFLYNYEINVENCTECYPAIGNLYYWGIYPVTISDNEIVLLIK